MIKFNEKDTFSKQWVKYERSQGFPCDSNFGSARLVSDGPVSGEHL